MPSQSRFARLGDNLTPSRNCRPDYEVFTVFVQSGEDMSKLMPPSIAAAMTGRHRQGPSHEVTRGEGWYFKLALRRCAAYFLWPVMATDGEGEQSGMVHQVRPFRSLTCASAPVFFPSRAHRVPFSRLTFRPLLELPSALSASSLFTARISPPQIQVPESLSTPFPPSLSLRFTEPNFHLFPYLSILLS